MNEPYDASRVITRGSWVDGGGCVSFEGHEVGIRGGFETDQQRCIALAHPLGVLLVPVENATLHVEDNQSTSAAAVDEQEGSA